MKKKSRKKLMVGIVAGILTLALVWVAICGWLWSWGPLAKLHDLKTMRLPGNAAAYDVQAMSLQDNPVLRGKRVCFLGSSVTYGSAAMGVSFADYIGRRNGMEAVKEAVPGTTLVDSGPQSYIRRLEKLDDDLQLDLLVCQLSTNDASKGYPLGEVGGSFDEDAFDTGTVAGAIEHIIAYARATWGCPVVFFTSSRYESEAYAAMVGCLGVLQDKWQIGVIDLWSNDAFNDIPEEEYRLYMADDIHPTKAGYLLWWTPEMERQLTAYLTTMQPG